MPDYQTLQRYNYIKMLTHRVNTFDLPTKSSSLSDLSDGNILIAILAEM